MGSFWSCLKRTRKSSNHKEATKETTATEEQIPGTETDTVDGNNDSTSIQDTVKKTWERQQDTMKQELIVEDLDDWARHHITGRNIDEFPDQKPLRYIGGVDISFIKNDNVNACAAFVVLNFPDLQVIYEDLSMVELTAPYISGFLAFREAGFLVTKIEKLRSEKPDILPQVILVDGNGILHPREFGLACHLGVQLDIPTVGVAKKLLHVDGLEKNADHQKKIAELKKGGDAFHLIGQSGKVLGMALRSCDSTTNPIYVSPGHKISVDTALWVVKECCQYRIPEPTRQADIRSREYIRRH